MTQFKKENFEYFGGYLHYREADGTALFIARFKYHGGGRAAFQSFLIKNFTVEEYKELYATRLAPLQILQTKGYISPNVKKVLKSYGLPATQEGINQLHEITRREAQA